jgi:uncharacterized membrane protein
LVLVRGVGFFFKYAWEHEWIKPSPTGRVLFTTFVGVALAGVGEWLLRKGMRGLAAVLYAAGVATVMTAVFAANAYFSPAVLERMPAMILVVATAAVGIGLALRADLSVVAILSLLGAYLAPAVLRSDADQSVALLSYLLLLAGTGWGICLVRPHWNGVRGFVFLAGFIWYAIWFGEMGHRHESLAFAYLSMAFAGTLGEMFVTTQGQFRETPDVAAALGTRMAKLEASCAILSFVNTLLTSGALYVLYWKNQPLAGSLALGLAGIQGVVAVGTFSRQMRYSAILQSAALVTLAVPLLVSAFSINLTWMVMSIALVALGRRLDVRWLRPWGVALWLLAAGKLFILDFNDPALRNTLMMVGTHPLTHWLAMAIGVAITGHVVAFLGRRGTKVDAAGVSMAALGSLVFLVSIGLTWGLGGSATLAGILWTVGIVALRKQGRRIEYTEHAWTLMALLLLKWLIVDGVMVAVAAYEKPAADGLLPVLNIHALCGGILLGLFAYLGRAGEGTERENARAKGAVGVAVIGFFLANFELLRAVNHFAGVQPVKDLQIAKQVALSVLWSLTALGAITVGFVRRMAQVRYAGLGLLGVTLLKILLVDMAGVETIWRIVSFTAVGAMLMCVSFVYYKYVGD